MDKDELDREKARIAADILNMAQSTLLIHTRFLGAALARLDLVPYEGTIATDAVKIYYDATHILSLFRAGKEHAARTYLHVVLHCLFLHPFSNADRRTWDLACDMAVEAVICEWALPFTDDGLCDVRSKCLQTVKDKTGYLTAEKIYAYLRRGEETGRTLSEWETLFAADDHALWGLPDEKQSGAPGRGLTGGVCRADGKLQAERDWRTLAERLQTDLETFSKEWGCGSGNLSVGLREVMREKYDYESFLRKFAVMTETMKISTDEFDYIFYTLGLNLYGNLPLVEPLEYRDDKRVKELAIAIDTSGSVQGEKVRSFLRKTYNILKEAESYRNRVNIHIIQCDAAVRKDTKIGEVREIESLFSDFRLSGGGGTDFRPVFRYVDKLIADKEFRNLKGLIYFTDGYGNFPERKPPYETAFVFVDEGYNNYDVPSWAIKLVLEPKDL